MTRHRVRTSELAGEVLSGTTPIEAALAEARAMTAADEKMEQDLIFAHDTLRTIGDWRLNKAIEKFSEMRTAAIAAGLSDPEVAVIERYYGWFLMVREKVDAVVEAAP